MSDVSVQVSEEIRVKVPGELKRSFEAAVERSGVPVEGVLVELMRSYVESNEEPEEGYDEWFRSGVQAAIDDPRPSIPHAEVVAHMDALLERLVLEKGPEQEKKRA